MVQIYMPTSGVALVSPANMLATAGPEVVNFVQLRWAKSLSKIQTFAVALKCQRTAKNDYLTAAATWFRWDGGTIWFGGTKSHLCP